MGNCDPYSDPSEPMVVMQPQCTVEGADIVMQSLEIHVDEYAVYQDLDADDRQQGPWCFVTTP